MKTIRQIADEIGVSKQTVYKRYKGKLHTERSNGEVLEQSENVGVIAVLQTTIDTLQGQLAIKDKQIEDLNARLSESNAALVAAQQTAQAAQALHAGTIQQQLTSGTDQSEGSGDEPKKQGWFSRLFRG
ncbi:MAG: TetR family transcriptional regulator [Clostridia bacterium]|jgi:AcrR family transcriptional regulator|nr:TetR family transcriptional regulator [Clostridia bacterium]